MGTGAVSQGEEALRRGKRSSLSRDPEVRGKGACGKRQGKRRKQRPDDPDLCAPC